MTRPTVGPSRPWIFPTPRVDQLRTGLTVWRFELPGQHIATFELVLPRSLSAEPTSKEGVGTVALHAVDEGTSSHPDGEIGELLEAQGATLHGSARHQYTTFGGQSPSRRLPEVLPLFAEVLREPDYAERDVAHHVEAQIAAHQSRLASPGAASRMALRRELYGPEQRAGRPASGSPATLVQLTPDDARAWHSETFTPVGATLIVAGALPDEWLEFDWAGGPAPSEAATVPPRKPGRIVVLDRPGAVQATIVAGCRTVTRDDPRWPALRIAGHALAGAFASRLNLDLRERLAYSYGVSGGFSAGPVEGQFTVAGSVRSETAADAVARILDAVALGVGLSEAEVESARRYLIDVAPLANETSADIVAQASALAAAGVAPDYLTGHLRDLAGISADEATDAFRSTVRPDDLAVAIAGDAATLVPALTTAGLAATVVSL
ncbi:M16 family metallopeptidase [Tessaracoccus flavus]|uniref:Uncharacterized protein n=1 Tax=Tessaracoccus flavus TaxID=1610493 RepID=A0A1Q2CEM2_9ACTN|nr:pitrilysin family protein [Tessaracoccus flavus]AQP44572.1 hypothetical protein RPIT_06890 [Tessaracoccus flavus]SDZ09485.1 Predicted Zn-dependent peptidase [Tessaracoccus flavus]